MNLTDIKLTDIIAVLVVISYFVVAWWNTANSRGRLPSQNFTDNTQAMKTLNESVALASKRALEAELQVEAAEKKIVQAEAREENTARELEVLKRRVQAIDKRRYHIGFDVILGDAPEIMDAGIIRFTEQRTTNIPVEQEKRITGKLNK